jgi:hypothetical protein
MQEEEDRIYLQWKEHFEDCLREGRKDPLEHSIFQVYRSNPVEN